VFLEGPFVEKWGSSGGRGAFLSVLGVVCVGVGLLRSAAVVVGDGGLSSSDSGSYQGSALFGFFSVLGFHHYEHPEGILGIGVRVSLVLFP
jgi:hypothetical protein